jgi:6,7-dimethyl-8-ribityllumazine synthase
MASEGKSKRGTQPNTANLPKPVGIVTARWNETVTDPLTNGALGSLHEAGYSEKHLYKHKVPGAFELPLGVQMLAEQTPVKGVIAIGCLIQGETPHFDYIAQAVTHQLSALNLRYTIPVTYGLLTVYNQAQAQARAGGGEGNKGSEAADAMLEMMTLKQSLKGQKQPPGF